MSITEKLLKNSTIKMTAILDKSTVFNLSPPVATNLPILNLAFSGEVSGGFQSGLIVFAGESKTFKSNLLLLCVAAYLKKHSDAVCLFYDSEFGSKADYFLSFGIDPQRVIHSPITNVENFKFDLMAQVNEIEKKDHVIIAVDSVGNLASKKEVDDALKGESKADMTRAKAFKSLFRMVTPELTLRDIPMLVVAHVYSTQELYSKTIISGGTGILYAANEAFVVTKSQDKDEDGLHGFKFTINIEKSRSVKEKSKFPFSVKFHTTTEKGGIERFSGLLELAIITGHVVKPKNGWYTRPCVEGDKNVRESDTKTFEFWEPVLRTDFPKMLETMFKLSDACLLEA